MMTKKARLESRLKAAKDLLKVCEKELNTHTDHSYTFEGDLWSDGVSESAIVVKIRIFLHKRKAKNLEKAKS